jgi:hypothetical protein
MVALRREFESLHPLAEVDLYVDGKNILVAKYGTYLNRQFHSAFRNATRSVFS